MITGTLFSDWNCHPETALLFHKLYFTSQRPRNLEFRRFSNAYQYCLRDSKNRICPRSIVIGLFHGLTHALERGKGGGGR